MFFYPSLRSEDRNKILKNRSIVYAWLFTLLLKYRCFRPLQPRDRDEVSSAHYKTILIANPYQF